MSKAEERALERFPVHEGASKEWIEMHLKGLCAEYIEGYHQAEKDLELSWEDMMAIDDLLDELLPPRRDSDELVLKGYYEEVLKRFKNLKK